MHVHFILVFALKGALSASLPASTYLNPRSLDEITTENTCRWTNCDEQCPPGFSLVPRQGGAKNEMMWDHTHCGEKGMQYFCCPSNIDTPTCTWRGHKNSGRCKPGCNSGEVEVGSLRMGCKTGHQTACCTSVTAVEAYGQCKWVGKDPLCSIADPRSRDRSSHANCPESHPHFLFAASAGFGGETMCDTGAKSFCCKAEVRPFTNCKWHEKATRLRGDGVCEASCPSGQIKLGMQRDRCPGGEMAYCCEGPPPPPPPPPPPAPSAPPTPPPPPSFGPQLRDFQMRVQFLKNAMAAGWCGTKTSSGDSTDAEASESSERNGNPLPVIAAGGGSDTSPCVSTRGSIRDVLLDITANRVGAMTELQARETETWDRAFGWENEGTSIAELREMWENEPEVNSNQTITDMLLDVPSFSASVKAQRQAQRDLCRGFATTHKSTAAEFAYSAEDVVHSGQTWNSSHRIFPRVIQAKMSASAYEQQLNDRGRGVPWFGLILQGIVWQHLSLYFARWFWYRDVARGGQRQGPTLELAYWIGPIPGVNDQETEINLRLHRYRDTQSGIPGQQRPSDLWVVLHLHFDAAHPMINQFGPNQDSYVGLSAITMFHAQYLVETGSPAQLQIYEGDDALNARQVLQCPFPPPPGGQPARMWIGPNRAMLPSDPTYNVLGDWLFGLWRDGYLSNSGLIPIMHGAGARVDTNHDNQLRHNEPLDGYVPWRAQRAGPPNLLAFPWETPFRIENGYWPRTHGQYVYNFAYLQQGALTTTSTQAVVTAAVADVDGVFKNLTIATSEPGHASQTG